MSFFKTLRKGLKGAISAANADRYQINQVQIKCVHCGHDHFDAGEAQLNTAGATFVGFDWANRSASVFVCKQCSYIMWFANSAKKII
ncbi:hypothetical protein CA267_001255 [Alteromonas pelagimontana]|uniref:DNA-binding protein n=1 Tax=Alteromonas pelagimontana TaxID=1858656 RepID=A0A6M4M9P1_9ALTE|nr:zinc ribbon domain-containing protein [Alteromonas pelagimontana]QJR79518.1 hypothetical protein CA267_001255 [Alteromonas pelagimontana]